MLKRSISRRLRATCGVLITMAAMVLSGPLFAAVVVEQDTLDGHAAVIYRDTADTTFRFACLSPCPIPDATLRASMTGFRAGKALLQDLWGITVLPALSPVDIFFEGNALCTSPGSASAYATTYQPYGASGAQHGIVCLFQWDRFLSGAYGADWFTPEHAGDLEHQVLILHEFGHTVLYGRHFSSYEDIVTYYSFRATGAVALPQGACSGEPLASFAFLVNLLCQMHGVQDADQKASWQALEQVFQQGLGYIGDGRTSISQWRRQLDLRLGKLTGTAFLLAGFSPQQAGGEFSVTPAGGRIDILASRFRLDVPANAVSVATALKLEAANCLAPHPQVDFSLAFEIVAGNHRSNAPLPWPTFNAPVQLRYSFAHIRPASDVDPRLLRLYRMNVPCSDGTPVWEEVPNARLDPVRRLVSAPITRGGTYALLPGGSSALPGIADARVLPHAGPWYQAATSGSGFDIEYINDQAGLAVTWYTYRPDGTPIWYLSVGSLTADGQLAPLSEVTRNADGTRTITEVGQLRLRFTSRETATLDWSIGTHSGTISDLVFLRYATGATRSQANGLWYTPLDAGWGSSVWSQGNQEYWVFYLYDGQGRPVWLSSLLAYDTIEGQIQQLSGACPWCAYVVPTIRGGDSRMYRQHRAAGSGWLITNFTLQTPLQGSWIKSRQPWISLTDFVVEQ